MKRNHLIFVLSAGMAISGKAWGAPAYSTSFETPDFTVGPMSPDGSTAQGGWSGGAQGGFTNNDHTLGNEDEAITTAEAHSGTQSWRLSRGYNSPGQGTPFTPNLDAGVVNDGDTFSTTMWFKAGSAAADDSSVAIETGTAAGDDRGNYLAFLTNEAGGVRISSFTNGGAFDEVNLFTAVSTTDWHKLEMSLVKNGYTDTVSVSLDGGAPVSYDAALNDWRAENSFAYAESWRLKFRPRQDGDLSDMGFYFDDVSYTSVVPEPGSLSVLAGGAALLLMRRRRTA